MFTKEECRLPVEKIVCDGVELKFLFDSGSVVNLISRYFLPFLSDVNIKKCNTPILTVTGERVPLTECVELSFLFKNVKCKAKFLIVDDDLAKEFSGILGMPFLTEYGAVIKCRELSVTLDVGEQIGRAHV